MQESSLVSQVFMFIRRYNPETIIMDAFGVSKKTTFRKMRKQLYTMGECRCISLDDSEDDSCSCDYSPARVVESILGLTNY